MALETGTFINSLVATNPAATDALAAADDHLRLIKSTIKNTFPNLTGAVNLTETEANILDGATLTTAELNILDGVTSTEATSALVASIATSPKRRGCSYVATSLGTARATTGRPSGYRRVPHIIGE